MHGLSRHIQHAFLHTKLLKTNKDIQRYIVVAPDSVRPLKGANAPSSHESNAKSDTTELATVPRILVEKDANITLMGINRERSRNCIDTETAVALYTAIRNFEKDDTSHVGVLYGVGGSFSAGQDLAELREATEWHGNSSTHPWTQEVTRRQLRKPIVCAINGFCLASGIELALHCDLRVMEDTAVMGFFNRRFDVPLSDVGSVRLTKAIGYTRALDVLLTGRRISGAEALRIGLVNRLVATGTALGQAVNVAFSIAKFPLSSLQRDRGTVYANTYEPAGSLKLAAKRECVGLTKNILLEMMDGACRFKNSKCKGAKSESWHIKKPNIPDWEQVEIAFEESHLQRTKR